MFRPNNNWERPGGPGAGPEMHRMPGHRPPFYGPGSGPRPGGPMNMHGLPGRGHGPRHMGMRMDGMHDNMGPGGPMSGHWRGPGPGAGMRMMGPGPGGPGPGGRPPMMPGPGRGHMPNVRMGMSHGQPPEPVRMLFQLQAEAEAEVPQIPPSSQPQNEDVKFKSLQDQALQWQATAPVRKVVETVQQQAASQEQWQNYQKQMQAYQQQYQQWYQTQEAALVNVKLEDLKEKKATCEKQLSDWKTQFDQWVDQHKKHPNKDQFDQYQNQWKNWQTQMESMVNSLDMQIKIKEGSLQKDPFKNTTSSQPLGSVGDSVKQQGVNTAVPSVGQGMMPPTGPGIGQGPPIAPSRPDIGQGPGGLGAGPRPTGSGMGPGPAEMNPSLKPSMPGSIPGPGPGPRLESEKKLNTGPELPGPKGMMPGKDSFPFPFPDDFPFPGDIDNFSFPDMKKLDAMFSGGFKTDDFPFPFPDFPMAPGMMGPDFPLPEGLKPEDMTKDMDEFMKQMESELGKVSADFSKASRVDQSKQQALKPKEFQGPVDRERVPKGIDPALSRQPTSMGGGMPGMERSSRSSMDFDRSRTEQGYRGSDQGPHSMERRRQEIDRGLSGMEKGFPGMDRGPSRMEMGGPGMERAPRGMDRGPQGRDRGPQIDQGRMGRDRDPQIDQGRMGRDRDPMGRDRGPMEMDRGPMGMDRDLPGMNRRLTGMERGPIGMDRGPPEMDRGLVRMDRDPPGMNRGSSEINRGPIGMERGLPEMDKGLRRSDRGQNQLDQGPPGMESGPPGMEHGPPGMESGRPGMERGLPDMSSDPARKKRGQQGVDSSPSGKGSSPPGIESGPPGEESEEPRSEKFRLGIGSILAGLKSGPSGIDSDQQGKKTGPPGKKKIDKRPPGTDSRPPGMDNGPSGMDRGLGLGSILAGLKSDSSGMGSDQPEKKTGSSGMSRIDRGPSRRDSRPPGIDDGPPGMDSGPPGMDSGPPGMDSGPPGMDSGPPGLKRGLGLGSILAGLKSGPPGMDTGPPGVEKRPPGVNIAPPVSGMGPPGMSRGPPGMDIRPPGMDSLPLNMGTLPLSLTRGPPGPPGVDVGPPGAEHDSLRSHPLGVKKPPPSFEDVGPPGEDNIPPAVPYYPLGTVQGPVGFGNSSSIQEAFEEPAPPGMEPPSKPQEPTSKPQVSTQLPRDPAPPGMEETYPPGMEPEQEAQPIAKTEPSKPPEENLSEFEQRQNKPLFPPSAPSKGLTQHFYQVGQSIPITGMVKDSYGASSFVSSKQTLTPSPLAGYEALESVKAKKEEKKVKVEPKLEEKKKGKGKKGNMNMPATIKFGETKNLKDSDESAKKKEPSKDEPSKDEKKVSSSTDSSKDETVKDTKVKKTEKEKSPPKEVSKRVAMRSTLPFITDSGDDKSMMPSSIGELFKKNSNPSAFSKEGKTSNRSYRKAAEDEEEEEEAPYSKKAYRKDRDTRGRDDSLRTAAPSPPKSYRSQDRRSNRSYSPDKRRHRSRSKSRSRSRSPDRRKRRRDSPPRKRNSYSPGKKRSPQRRKNSRSPSRGKSNRSPDRRDRRDDKYRDDRRDRYQKDSERRGDKPSTEAFDKLRELIYDTLVRQPEDKPKDSPHGDRRRPDERERIGRSRSPYSMDRSRSPLRSRRENYYPEAERPRMQHPPPRRDYVRDPLRDESRSLPRDPPRDAPWPAQREPSRDFDRSTSQDRLGERARSPPVAEKSAPIVFEYSHAETTRPAYDIDKREPIGSLLSHAAVVDVLDYSHGQSRIPQAKAVSGSSLLQERESMLPSEFVVSTERQHADGGDTNIQQQQQQLPPQPPHEPPPQPSPPQPPKQQNQQQPPQQQMPYQDQQLQQFPQQPSEQVYQYQSDDPTQFDPYNEQYQQLGSQMAFQMQQQQMQAFQQMGQYQDQYNTQQQEQFQQPPPPPPDDSHSNRKSPPPPPPPAPPPPAPSKEDSFQQSWAEAPPPPPPSDPYTNTRQGSSGQPEDWDTSRGRRGDSRQRERVDKYQSGSTRLVEDYRDSPGQKDMFTNSPQQTPPRPTKPKKREVVAVTDILDPPNREKRPAKICVVLRGPPGSGKSYIAKLIKDREIHNKGPSPRMLCLDDYFMSEKEKTEKDPETGKMVKKRFQEYEYEDSMESIYHVSLLKTFKKTIEDGFFDFIIVDAVNDKISKIEPFWTYAKMKGFEVYVAELLVELGLCIQRDIHNRGEAAIRKIIEHWEFAPRKYIKLDVVALLQDAAIPEVEMEEEEMDTGPSMEELMSQQHEALEELEDQEETLSLTKSKWDTATEDKLDALDGIKKYKKKDYQSMEDFLSGGDEFDFVSKPARPGQKTVRWADIEERQNQERMRALGFIVGQTATDWAKITDDNYADKALNRTKYI